MSQSTLQGFRFPLGSAPLLNCFVVVIMATATKGFNIVHGATPKIVAILFVMAAKMFVGSATSTPKTVSLECL